MSTVKLIPTSSALRNTQGGPINDMNRWPYPWKFPISTARAVSRRGSVASPDYGFANQVEVCSFLIPLGFEFALTGIVTAFAGSGFIDGAGDVIWTLDVDQPLGAVVRSGYAVPDYASIVDQLGSFVQGPWPIEPVILRDGQTVRLKAQTVQNVGTGSPNLVRGGILGHVWPALRGQQT